MSEQDTIYALATPYGRSGVAVVRVSGPQAFNGMLKLTGKKDWQPRHATLTQLFHPVSRETIDRALVVYFQSPASYTGEGSVEYHIHGGRAIINQLLDALSLMDGHRLAEPGEFTRRAFESGKMDLTAAEAVADLIDAETAYQKRQALRQMGGGLFNLYQGWTDQLKEILAHVEADIEFPDEDLPEGIFAELKPRVEILRKSLDEHLSDKRRGERLRDGVRVVILGIPNAGKSTLINAMAQRDVAIVSDLAGTTRDILEVFLDLGGYPVILSDTAGLRPRQLSEQGHDKIESEGIRRALEKAKQADIKVLMIDGSTDACNSETIALKDESSIVVLNKSDLSDKIHDQKSFDCAISAQTGEGIDLLNDILIKKIEDVLEMAHGGEAPSLTRQRHRAHLEDTSQSLARALEKNLPELVAEDLRLAIRKLGKVTGTVDVEDILDVIFSDFCIGK